jgi:Arc/MetJ family transcription regulator
VRTNIDIDDELLREAMSATGQTTKRATVEEALRTVVRLRAQRQALEELRGIGWEGDLDAIREGRDWSPQRQAERRGRRR